MKHINTTKVIDEYIIKKNTSYYRKNLKKYYYRRPILGTDGVFALKYISFIDNLYYSVRWRIEIYHIPDIGPSGRGTKSIVDDIFLGNKFKGIKKLSYPYACKGIKKPKNIFGLLYYKLFLRR